MIPALATHQLRHHAKDTSYSAPSMSILTISRPGDGTISRRLRSRCPRSMAGTDTCNAGSASTSGCPGITDDANPRSGSRRSSLICSVVSVCHASVSVSTVRFQPCARRLRSSSRSFGVSRGLPSIPMTQNSLRSNPAGSIMVRFLNQLLVAARLHHTSGSMNLCRLSPSFVPTSMNTCLQPDPRPACGCRTLGADRWLAVDISIL
eukprot:1804014-Rhodomonas_salina.1